MIGHNEVRLPNEENVLYGKSKARKVKKKNEDGAF